MANWSEEREKEYLEQLKTLDKKHLQKEEQTEKVEINGVLVPKKLVSRELNRVCPTCKTYSFDIKDDVYMAKYECCASCYIHYVEDREERWLQGWRPDTGDN
jgi:ferredoxin-like protein FixX